MKISRSTKHHIVAIQAEAGVAVKDLRPKHGISSATSYQ